MLKPIMSRILEFFRAWIPPNLKVSRKTFSLVKISWALCNNNKPNLSKCLLIPITSHKSLPLRQSEVAHSHPVISSLGLGVMNPRESGSSLHGCNWQSWLEQQQPSRKVGMCVGSFVFCRNLAKLPHEEGKKWASLPLCVCTDVTFWWLYHTEAHEVWRQLPWLSCLLLNPWCRMED